MTHPQVDRDERWSRAAGIGSIQLGATRVSFVPDGAGCPRPWLPGSTAQAWSAHPKYLDDSGYLVASIGGPMVERDGRALLIDAAGFGPQPLSAQPGSPNGAIYGGALVNRGPGLAGPGIQVVGIPVRRAGSGQRLWSLDA
ncbi:hypothetical protein [Nocardia sp. NPDC004750]